MNRTRAVIDILWSILTMAVFVVLSALADEALLHMALAAVSSAAGTAAICHRYMSWLAESGIRDNNWRNSISQRLSGGSWLNEVLACVQLAVASGNRYGILHKDSVAQWRNWWESHRERLKWEPAIGRLVEISEG